MSTTWALIAAFLLLVANGFFVAAEFALVASKPHRLEEAAAAGSRAARAAMQASKNLSLTLAAAQLGITLCSLGIGALAEPALEHIFSPAFHSLGIPDDASHIIAFVLSLMLVVFLHMVVGEMAPKSWAITNPERSATLLSLPFTSFETLVRPLLRLLNTLTNGILRLFGIKAQDELAQVHGPEELQMLLEQSKKHGTLPDAEHVLLSRMLRLQRRTIANVMIARPNVVTVTDTAADVEIERVSRKTGRSRLAVTDAGGAIIGLVHVREAVRSATTGSAKNAAGLMNPPLAVDSSQTIAAAVEVMRVQRSQLAVVVDHDVQVGVVALEDLLEQILGQFDDETD